MILLVTACIILDLNHTYYQDKDLFQNTVIKEILVNILFIWSKENRDTSYRQGMNEILAVILFALYWLESYWASNSILSKTIVYETIENIHPNNHDKLKKDLENRLGVEIIDFKIGDVNFLRDTAEITIKYKA